MALNCVAGEANSYAAVAFIVDNNYLVVPTLDANNKLVSWTKQEIQNREVIQSFSYHTYLLDVEESELSQLIGEDVKPFGT